MQKYCNTSLEEFNKSYLENQVSNNSLSNFKSIPAIDLTPEPKIANKIDQSKHSSKRSNEKEFSSNNDQTKNGSSYGRQKEFFQTGQLLNKNLESYLTIYGAD